MGALLLPAGMHKYNRARGIYKAREKLKENGLHFNHLTSA